MSMENLPKVHPREEIVYEAQRKLREVLCVLEKELTWGEYLRLITNEFCSEWQSIARSTIREERHPDDSDKPGGWE